MRELKYAKSINPKYHEEKHLTKKQLIMAYSAIGIFFILSVLTKWHIILFLFVTTASVIINYHTSLMTIRINPDPEVFSSLLITHFMGVHYAIIFLLGPILFTDFYTARLDKDTFVSFILTLVICAAMPYVPLKFAMAGAILVVIKFIVGLIIHIAIDIELEEIMFEHVLGFVINLLLFLAFGSFFEKLF